MAPVHQPINRREFLRVLGGATLFSCLPHRLRAAEADPITLSILHTTDLHGRILPTMDYDGVPDLGGFARCATQIRQWKKENPHHLLVDMGDVYQGTQVGLATRGRIMIDAFNHLGYDAWVIGNHEFDWGIEPVHEALLRSNMPVLCANCTLADARPGAFPDADHPFARIAPFVVKVLAGFKIGLVGVTTPGIPYWLHESLYEGMEFLDPIEPVRGAIRELRRQKVDAILIGAHMGLARGGDNFANRCAEILQEFPEVTAYLAGHTHQNIPRQRVRGVWFTQAGYHGIHVGRLDLTFDRTTRALLDVNPTTRLMDESVPADPAILSMAQHDLDHAASIQATPVGRLGAPLSTQSRIGEPSGFEELMAAAVTEALGARNIRVDGVVHGSFDSGEEIPAGPKTVADIWSMVPYENRIVTAQLNRTEINIILHELFDGWFRLSLMGMSLDAAGFGDRLRIREIFDAQGIPLRPRRRYTLAFNSYDAQSGGQRYMRLRQILRRPTSGMLVHPVLTRDAVIGYFSSREAVRPEEWKRAAQPV